VAGVEGARNVNTETAYRACEEITRREAKNFGYGIRLLRVPERHALSAVYALARRIDDIGDGVAPPAQKLVELARVRESLHALHAVGDDPVLVAVAAATDRYQLPLGAFDELIDGCENDVRGTSYATFDDLVVYCRLVAGSIGRLSLAVFGTTDAGAVELADDLGVALQLTNILRDVREDRGNGRVYLPAADAVEVGCPPDLSGSPAALAELVAFECARAHEWFERGLQLLPLLDRRSRACVGAMAGIYYRLLVHIERDPMAVTSRRISLPAAEKVWIAGRSVVGGRP
jgi:phytoene synthase